MSEVIQAVYKSVLEGNIAETQSVIQSAIKQGVDAGVLLQEGLIKAMAEVGRLFEAGEYFVPEMLISARAMQAGLNHLRPMLVEFDVQPSGRVIIGTVKGDLHDIGKNLVSMMLEGAGFTVLDLGTDVAPEKFVEAVRDGADILGLSALLTTTMVSMQTTIKAIEDAGLRNEVKILVGGAPVTQAYADQIGADGFAADASRAAVLANILVEK